MRQNRKATTVSPVPRPSRLASQSTESNEGRANISKDTFWLVWNLEKGIPARRHSGLMFALQEAKRLADKFPGEIFYVVNAVGMRYTPKGHHDGQNKNNKTRASF